MRLTHVILGDRPVHRKAEKNGQEGHEAECSDIDWPSILAKLEGPLAVELAFSKEKASDWDCISNIGQDNETR